MTAPAKIEVTGADAIGEPAGVREVHRTCLLCGSGRHRTVFEEHGIDVLRCGDCGHVFSSFAAKANYDEFWGEAVEPDEHFYWSRARARMHEDFFRRFLAGRSGRLLDIGCGLGFFLKAMATYETWEGYGYEISPAAVRYAHATLGLERVFCGQPDRAEFPAGSFDIVTMWDVMEHFLEPDPVLQRCRTLLRTGGICFIHTPNVLIQIARARLLRLLLGMRPGVTYLQARDHLHHYSSGTIRRLLERNGFSGVQFVHLHPVQSVSGSKSVSLRWAKNAWFNVARLVAAGSGGGLNLDNLFVIAKKA